MKKGFTLIELMVVIGIIGIFAVISFLGYTSSLSRTRDTTRLSDLKSLSGAAENYFQDGSYKDFPTQLTDLNSYFGGGNIPKDPKGIPYTYAKISTPSKGFCIGAKMEKMTQTNLPCSTGGDENYTVKGP